MQTLTAEYEGTTITLARPKLSDGQVRHKIWEALEKIEGARTGTADVFAYIVTQVTASAIPGYEVPRYVVYPGDEAIAVAYDAWCQVIDEAFSNQLATHITDLNGYAESKQAQKKASAPSSAAT